MLSGPDGFMMYGELGVGFFFTSKLLHANKRYGLQLIISRSKI